MAKNYIFLDFDGVCNTAESGSYLSGNPDTYGTDPYIMRLLRDICNRTDSHIIIASNWRRYEKFGFWVYDSQRYFNPIPGLMQYIGDLVDGDLSHKRHIRKSEALKIWFDEHPDFNGNYVIIDDELREGYQNVPEFVPHLYLTDPRIGITDKMADDIVNFLNSKV